MSARGEVEIVGAGDAALVARFEPVIDPAVNARAVATAAAFGRLPLPGIRDLVVSYAAVTVYLDPLAADETRVREALARCAAGAAGAAAADRPPIDVPVCYGGEYGEDLGRVAAFAACGEDEAAARHAGRIYRVYMLGFVAGFAYMGTVDPSIAVPRLPLPRQRVPAGSVGIAGPQTGIYPLETPGGWHLIGRTPVRPYDLRRDPPFLFEPGDRVRFVPIAAGRYRELMEGG